MKHHGAGRRICIVLVNWNGGDDTLACMRSLERLDPASGDISVVVVDNASSDGSPGRIEQALHEAGYTSVDGPSQLAGEARLAETLWLTAPKAPLTRIALARNRSNLGFAAGNNIGYALAKSALQPEFIWLLNNDTEVRPDCILRLVEKMDACPDVGICGCSIVFFGEPDRIQCSGGVRYSPVTGRGWLIGAGLKLADSPSNAQAEAQTDFINGAAMFLRCSAVDRIGLMAEEYFLFNEEIDWAWRARGHFRLGVETAAVVLHKEGATIGTATSRQRASPLANFFQTRSKLLFARKFTPWFLPTVWLTLLARFARQYLAGDHDTSWIILQVLFGRRRPDAEWFRRRGPRATEGP